MTLHNWTLNLPDFDISSTSKAKNDIDWKTCVEWVANTNDIQNNLLTVTNQDKEEQLQGRLGIVYLVVETSIPPIGKKSHHRSRRIHSRDQAEGWTGVFDTEYMEWKFLMTDLRATMPMELFTLCMNLPTLTFFVSLTSHLSSASHGQWGQENNLSHSLFCWSLRHVIKNDDDDGTLRPNFDNTE